MQQHTIEFSFDVPVLSLPELIAVFYETIGEFPHQRLQLRTVVHRG